MHHDTSWHHIIDIALFRVMIESIIIHYDGFRPRRLALLIVALFTLTTVPSLAFVHYHYRYNANLFSLHRDNFPHHFICNNFLSSLSLTTIPTAVSSSSSPSEPTITSSTYGNESKSIDDDESRRRLLLHKFSSLRSIGVDYGLSRTGIAITTGGYQPRPLTILSGLNNTQQLSSCIVDYVLSERATNIVLGLPLHKNGTSSEQSSLTRIFGMELLKEVRRRCGPSVHVHLWDERYTSKEAAARIAAEAIDRKSVV